MNRKVLVNIIIALTVILSLLLGVRLLRENYASGVALYNECNRMWIQSRAIADNIAALEEKFESGGLDDLSRDRHAFDVAFQEAYLHFGADFLGDVNAEYYHQFKEIYNQAVLNDRDNQKLIQWFTDQEASQKLSALKEQMEHMSTTFAGFYDEYNKMSEWERYFYSWNNVRKALADKLKIS